MAARGAAFALGLLFLLAFPASGPQDAAAEDPVAELTRALQSLGAPGLLWGRLAVEEESPDGPTTPLAGIEVALYPYVPSLAADLDRIRERARASGAEYDTAVARLQERLKAFEAQVAALQPRSPSGAPGQPSQSTAGADSGLVRRRTTDAAGIFVIEDLPSGEWLLVALHVSPYRQPKEQPRSRSSPRKGREFGGFLNRPATPAKEAEVWVSRVRVAPGDRSRALLTDRSRFMVGPVR